MSLEDQIEKVKAFDLSDLDVNQAGQWPLLIKVAAWVIVIILIVGGSYLFAIKDSIARLEGMQREEIQLREDFGRKAFQSSNLEALKGQLLQMQEAFAEMLKQLPRDTEVPSLLEDITNVAIDSGLSIETIKLLAEVQTEYYVELPINIEVQGGYHDFGSFVSGVAALPRIVTLHDFSIATVERQSAGSIEEKLKLSITAKTYRYTDTEEDGS
jgi:type IV pilus assembly protein PilO